MNRSHPFRWLRVGAIAAAAVILASCRSLTAPVVLPATGIVAAGPTERPATDAAAEPDEQVRPAGLEADCPPLPRLPALHARHGRCGPCETCNPAPAACGPCPPTVCLPPPGVPTVGPCLVCDGGDHGAAARPVGRRAFRNLTAGDTVARYRAADVEPLDDRDVSEVGLAISNCTCVYAPRFSSVRELIRPHEESAPAGPQGVAVESHLDAAVESTPVLARACLLVPGQARLAQPGLAVEERLPPLAVDQADLPEASIGAERALERALEERPEQARVVTTPRIAVGFDVPLAWTCVQAAQVTVAGRSAEVVASDQGTATLRLEEPGRCELTLCKRAGSDTARVGEELDFTIFLLNSGDRALADVVLVDAIPKRLALVPDSAAASLPAEIGTASGDDGSVVVTWRFTGTLRPGEGGFVRFRTIVR